MTDHIEDRPFTPNWTSPPGDTIRDLLDQQGLSLAFFTRAMGYDDTRQVDALLSGATELTGEIAERLSALLGSTTQFWLTRESQYRADLVRLATDQERP